MKTSAIVILILCLICNTTKIAFAQTLTQNQLIAAWKASDTSQTTKAEITYADLRANYNEEDYRQRIKGLNAFLKNHPDKRLQVRTWMYEILGKLDVKLPLSAYDKKHIIQAISIADIMEDSQLLSELYSLYARFEEGTQDDSYYVLKSLEMQQQIGEDHFPFLYLRFLNFSINMYSVGEYIQSIQYGTQALELMKNKPGDYTNKCRILQLDYLGSCYKQLNMPDSVLYYYNKLEDYIFCLKNDSVFTKTWRGIAFGGIGQALALKKNYKEALPYLYANIQSSVALKIYDDAALSLNSLAQIDFANNKYDSALNKWQTAYEWLGTDTLTKMHICESIRDLFKKENKYDSVYYYDHQYNIFKSALDKKYNESRLSVLQTRIEFDNMQNSLQKARSDIAHEKNIHLLLIAGIVLLIIIVILWYNRMRLKQEYAIQQANARQRFAELEIEKAKEQLKSFIDKIIEHENLIEQLKISLSANAETEAAFNQSLLQYSLITNEVWEKFRIEFLKAYPNFLLFYPRNGREADAGRRTFNGAYLSRVK